MVCVIWCGLGCGLWCGFCLLGLSGPSDVFWFGAVQGFGAGKSRGKGRAVGEGARLGGHWSEVGTSSGNKQWEGDFGDFWAGLRDRKGADRIGPG